MKLSRVPRPTRTDRPVRVPGLIASRVENGPCARHAPRSSSRPGCSASLALVALSVAGCGGCPPSVPSELRVEGAVPFVRCLAFEPPDARSIRAGSHAFEIEDRIVRVEGFGESVELAVFAGPGAGELDRALLEGVTEDVVIVLGGFGRTRESVAAFFDALVARDALVLLVAGGDDDADVYRAALDELDDEAPIADATALDRIDFGFASIAFAGGAPQGRYARTASSCGYTEADLDALTDRLESIESPLFVAAWAAPVGPAGAIEGAEAGDPLMRAFMTRVDAKGGLFAWPESDAGRLHGAPDRVEMVVSSVANLAVERADGTRVRPAVTRVTVSARGLAVAPNEP